MIYLWQLEATYLRPWLAPLNSGVLGRDFYTSALEE